MRVWATKIADLSDQPREDEPAGDGNISLIITFLRLIHSPEGGPNRSGRGKTDNQMLIVLKVFYLA
jgi:hypothetical protein